jgi:tetratricopeptide (TPR) repeat protein
MSSVHHALSVALASALFAGACTTRVERLEVPARVAADLTLVERAAAARVSGDGRDAGRLAGQVAARADTMDASLRWYIAAGRVGEALRFATAMSPFWRTQGRVNAGRQLIAAVLALPDSAAQHRARAAAWYEAGVLAFRQRDQEASRNANEQSLRLAIELADTEAIAQALVGLSRVELRAGAYDSVRAHAGKASVLLTQTGDTLGAIGPSHMVAAVNRMTGRDGDAASLYERTLARYRSLSDAAGVAGELMNLGYVRLHQGRRSEARSLFREALGRFMTLRDEVSQEFLVAAFAAVAADAGDGARAAKLYGAARKLLAASGVSLDPDDQYELDRYTAKARGQLGDAAYARALGAGEALTLVEALRLAQSI